MVDFRGDLKSRYKSLMAIGPLFLLSFSAPFFRWLLNLPCWLTLVFKMYQFVICSNNTQMYAQVSYTPLLEHTLICIPRILMRL